MPHYNKTLIMGHLTRDIELQYLPSNMAVGKFGMATNRKWKTPQGEEREEVLFIDCTAFGKTAETLNQYCRKGHPLFVEGHLKLDTWEDKNGGGKRSKIHLIVDSFQFLKSGGSGEGDSQEQTAPTPRQQATRPPDPGSQPATPRPTARQPEPRTTPPRRQEPAISEDANPISDKQLFKPDDIPF